MYLRKMFLSVNRLNVSALLFMSTLMLVACSDVSVTPEADVGQIDVAQNDGTNGGPESDQDPATDDIAGNNPPIPAQDPEVGNRNGLLVTGLDGMPAEDLTSPWIASIVLSRSDSSTTEQGDAIVRLVEYEEPVSVSGHIEFYATTLETCEFRDLTAGAGGGGAIIPGANGGESLTINTGSGPWFEIPADQAVVGRYDANNRTPGALPADATLSIPGDQFPNVAAYDLSEPPVPVRITPAKGFISAEDVAAPFTWEPGPEDSDAYILIGALAYNSDGSFAGFPVLCNVVDDGEFNLPSEALEAFANTTLDIDVRYERVFHRIDYINNIVFRQLSAVAE